MKKKILGIICTVIALIITLTSCANKFFIQDISVSGWNYLPGNEIKFSLGEIDAKILNNPPASYRHTGYRTKTIFTVKDGISFINALNKSPYLIYKSDDNEYLYDNNYLFYDNNNFYRIQQMTMFGNTNVVNTFTLESCTAIYDIQVRVGNQGGFDLVARYEFPFYSSFHTTNFNNNEGMTFYTWEEWEELYRRMDDDICFIDEENKAVYLKSMDVFNEQGIVMTDYYNIKLSWYERNGKYYYRLSAVDTPNHS